MKWLVAIAVAACGAPATQSAQCRAYLACAEAVSPGITANIERSYGATGTCWADAPTAKSCTATCESLLGQQATAHPEVPACR